MTSGETTNQIDAVEDTWSIGRTVAGLVLLLPAILCCVIQLLIPTMRTVWLSLQKSNLLTGESTFVGLQNYSSLVSDTGFAQTLGFTFSFVVTRLLVVAVVPLLLAWAVGQFSRPVRLGLRIVLMLPVVLFVPVAIAVTWRMALHPITGLFISETPALADPDRAGATLLFIDALYMLGLACGLGLIFYLPLWRRPLDTPPPTFRETLKPLLATWGLGILATIALTLNVFTLNFMMTGGGPGNSTTTLGLWLYQFAFRSFRFGPGASLAGLILLVALGLGVVAGLLVILTRLRLTTVNSLPASEQEANLSGSQPSKTWPVVVLVLTLLPALGACALGALPFGWLVPQSFGADSFARLLDQISAGQVLVNTFIPTFITAGVQLLIAYLAALGIGALQPFGKRSTWLLLVFSPWLFVTMLPLSIAGFTSARDFGTLNTFLGLISPILFSVPALFILTLFFKGQAALWQRASTAGEMSSAGLFIKHLVLPSLPLAGVLFLFLVLIGWQDFVWPLLISSDRANYTVSVVLSYLMASDITGGGLEAAAVTLFILPVTLFLFVLLILCQIFYLDRLVLYSDDESVRKLI